MRRTTWNFVVDAILFVDLLLLTGTGTILKWVLPPGSGGGAEHGFRGGRGLGPGGSQVRQLLGLGRHDWGDIHFALALLFILLILGHLVLHWTWIKACSKSLLLGSRKVPCDRTDGSNPP